MSRMRGRHYKFIPLKLYFKSYYYYYYCYYYLVQKSNAFRKLLHNIVTTTQLRSMGHYERIIKYNKLKKKGEILVVAYLNLISSAYSGTN